MKSDNILLQKIAQGDQIAFKAFFEHYYPELLNYAFYIVESRYAAEEIVSSVFINIWQQRSKLVEVKNLRSYLFVSVKNRSYNYVRDNRQIQAHEEDHDRHFLSTSFENPESLYLSEELRKIILDSIEQLPARCKMIFRLVREDGMKYKEVAELLDISVKTVEVQMGRAIAKLKTTLSPYLKDLPVATVISKIAQMVIIFATLHLIF